MMEDWASGMTSQHGCNNEHDEQDAVVTFKEAIRQRVGEERYQVWFGGIRFLLEDGGEQNDQQNTTTDSGTDSNQDAGNELQLVAIAPGQFAADRLTKDFGQPLRAAAAATLGRPTRVVVRVQPASKQNELPFDIDQTADTDQTAATAQTAGTEHAPAPALSVPETAPAAPRSNAKAAPANTSPAKRQPRRSSRKSPRGNASSAIQSLGDVLEHGSGSPQKHQRQATDTKPQPQYQAQHQPSASRQAASKSTGTQLGQGNTTPPTATKGSGENKPDDPWSRFIAGKCNEMARTACTMVLERPTLASPLVLWGPAGCGKSHMLAAIASRLRRHHRMSRVIVMSAEEFTNSFLRALQTNGLPNFRNRFRDCDALLIDDVQFLVEKKATIREMHHTMQAMSDAGKPIVFAGTQSPGDINGLGGELSGRLASGLVCHLEPLDVATRATLLQRCSKEKCLYAWPKPILQEIAESLGGDGRLVSGVVNLVSVLQRMHGAMPTMDQIRQHGSHLLQSRGVTITLAAIERQVERKFHLEPGTLQSSKQTKTVTEPRMLAMYLSRELTSSAYSEIGGHFGGRSHSTAILAHQRVRQWLQQGQAVGRGQAAVSAAEALRQIESLLKSG